MSYCDYDFKFEVECFDRFILKHDTSWTLSVFGKDYKVIRFYFDLFEDQIAIIVADYTNPDGIMRDESILYAPVKDSEGVKE